MPFRRRPTGRKVHPIAEVRRRIAPRVPREAGGFIFAVRGRAVGAALFSSHP